MFTRMGFEIKTRSEDMPEMQITILEQRPGEETMRTRPITFEVNENGCHICTSHAPNTKGYPTLMKSGKKWTIARYIQTQLHGKIPTGILVCHTCDNRVCINPAHLFLGTPKDNMTDMIRKNRKINVYGTRNGSNKLTEDLVLRIKCEVETLSCSEVGRKYNISIRTVNEIKNGRTWGWLTAPQKVKVQ